MSDTFVLVHGAYHGGWCWRRVASRLRAAGHEVFTPTLTGLGERAHLPAAEVGLGTVVQDVVAVLETEELTDVVLVGHSFGALAVLGAADRVPARIRRLVLLDGLVVDSGQCAFDGLPAEVRAQREADAARLDGGAAIPAPPATAFGLTDPDDLAWVNRRLTPHPLPTYREPLALSEPIGAGLPVSYLYCANPPYTALASGHEIVRREGWAWRELDTGHDAMISAPDLVTAELTRG
ncbi:alpha/beta fold hydrolase [Pseudonocardia bannensis]|uniref:Alpha/beta hydrolase n=1 Tax=Pseudonocardia bannensis TaxID=630973 RepID=A0A848DGQ0_9PSEU|nr:alpha/beta hydrolase family protein [Pseudonocardia bannensis]NMH91746.1 alpha/beta hydrolase [Pseudonocardia bannensis]